MVRVPASMRTTTDWELKHSTSAVRFSDRWRVLGPFRIGTREAVWGANPLETTSASFYQVCTNDEVEYHSSLSPNGTVRWADLEGHCDQSALTVQFDVSFPTVDWAFQQSVYGWAALQYQAFLSGQIFVSGEKNARVVLYTDGILEFAVNEEAVFGADFYTFRRAPVILTLVPGNNRIDVRLIRDVRAMGGLSFSMNVQLSIQMAFHGIAICEESIVIPEIVNGRLASVYGSLIVRNESSIWVKVAEVKSNNDSLNPKLLHDPPVVLAPGQSRPIGFVFDPCDQPFDCPNPMTLSVTCEDPSLEPASVNVALKQRKLHSPHKFTFQHPSGAVSYAILRAPICDTREKLPVLIALHGAGLEADSGAVRHALDGVPNLDAWVLFPSGMSPWSGDDWHVWGLADVIAAVAAIALWIETNQWSGPGVDVNKWCIVGHSNGGQGAWFMATHHPDKTIAVASASSYSSIQNYVPYVMWRDADPLAFYVTQNSLSTYRHELLTSNLAGIPVFQQHGAKDDNVPAFHSRSMSALLHEAGVAHKYTELAKQGHWFEGVMTTPGFREFYSSLLKDERSFGPCLVEYVIPNSGDLGSFGGIVVDQLSSPDMAGKIRKKLGEEGKIWELSTTNISRVHFDFSGCETLPVRLFLDGQTFDGPRLAHMALVKTCRQWKVADTEGWRNLGTRYGRQRGSLDSFLRATGSFCIQTCSNGSFDMALQTSRNLLQYYGADSELLEPGKLCKYSSKGNIVTLILGSALPPSPLRTFPLEIGHDLVLLDSGTKIPTKIPITPGMAAVFLRPLAKENLELVLWGSDDRGLRQAARMVPTLTGAGQPDFIIFRDEARWKGIAGVMAMGFFDKQWRVSKSSYCP